MDEEDTFDYVWANIIGIDTDDILIKAPDTLVDEEVFNIMS